MGGVTRKTLNVILGGVHVGKSMCLVHLACGYLRMGFNVLYISLEMGEDAVMQRVDANLLDTAIHKVKNLGKNPFMNRINVIRQKHNGIIKVKEFSTGSANVNHFKHAINELALKKKWTPDVIIVDYIGITASSKMKVGVTNSYFYLKSVAEELRALASETNTIVWTASQLTRSGMQTNDTELTDTAESLGIPAVADLMFSIYRDENMDNMGQFMVKQLKNRFRDKGYRLKFIIGCDREKQLLFDVSNDAQTLVDEDAIIETREIQKKYETSPRPRFGEKKKFNDFNMGDDQDE